MHRILSSLFARDKYLIFHLDSIESKSFIFDLSCIITAGWEWESDDGMSGCVSSQVQ